MALKSSGLSLTVHRCMLSRPKVGLPNALAIARLDARSRDTQRVCTKYQYRFPWPNQESPDLPPFFGLPAADGVRGRETQP